MSEQEEAGLRRLKQDLDEAEWPAPELLARYATEPNRLSESEKQQVERALASMPLVADELATLRGFDFASLDADRREAGAVGRQPASADSTTARSWLEGLRRRLFRPPVFAAVAAALALLLWLARSADRDAAPITPSPQTSPTLAEHRAPAENEDRTPAGGDGLAEVAPSTTADPTSPGAPEAEPEQALASRSGSAQAGSKIEQPAPTEGRGEGGRAEAGPGDANGAGDDRGELLLAMAVPDYRPAYGRDPMDGAEWIVRGSEAPSLRLTALAPDHVVRACSASPILHWSVDRRPVAGDFRLSIVDEDDGPIVDDRALPRPTRAGLQRVDLAAMGITLPVGRTLRWSIALREDEESPPTAFDFGWLRVGTPDAAAAADLASGSEGDRAAAYAALGCYAEAVEAVIEVRRRQPENASAERALARLAEQAGLPAALFR